MQKKEFARASLEFQTALSLQPKNAENAYRLGVAMLALKDRAAAAKAFLRATSADPKYWPAQVELASMLAHSGREEDRQDAQRRASLVPRGVPESAAASDILSYLDWRAGNVEGAEERLLANWKEFPAHIQSAIELAEIHVAGKRLEEAEQTLRAAVTKTPSSAELHFALGQVATLRNELADAAPEFQEALRLEPGMHLALARLSWVHERTGVAALAESDLRQLAETQDLKYVTLYARYLLRTGKVDASLAEYQRVAKAHPRERSIREEMISAYEAAGKSAEAEAIVDTAVRKDGHDAEALFRQSQILLKRGKRAEAEQNLEKVVRLYPNSAEVHYVLAGLYRSFNYPGRQKQELERALELKPRLFRARAELVRLYSSQGMAQAALQVADGAPPDQRTVPELALARNSALVAARQFGPLREALKGLPPGPETAYFQGVLSLNDKDYAAARARAETVLAGFPLSVDAWQLLAAASDGLKDRHYAVGKLETAIAAHPGSAQLQMLLGQWKILSADNAGARRAYEAALEIQPDLLDAQLRLAELDDMTGNAAAGLARAERLTTAHPESVRARVILAALLFKTERYADAATQYTKVLEQDGNNLAALNDLAVLTAGSNLNRAFQLVRQALDLAPQNPEVLDTAGWVECKLGRYDDAIRHLEAARNKDAANARIWYHLSLAQMKLGNNAAGAQSLKMAQQKDPGLAFLREVPPLPQLVR